jgi:hypothetical protein
VAAGDHDDAPRQPQPAQPVVVAADGHHRGNLLQVVQHPRDAEVARVEDQVAPLERREHPLGELVEELADMGVGDDADPPGQQR